MISEELAEDFPEEGEEDGNAAEDGVEEPHDPEGPYPARSQGGEHGGGEQDKQETKRPQIGAVRRRA